MRRVRLGSVLALALIAAAPPEVRALVLKAPNLDSPQVDLFPPPSRPRDPIQRALFERINRERETAGRTAVLWDEGAARAAEQFCARQVAERTRAHFLMDGIPPYARMALRGIFGLDSENSLSWITTGSAFSDPLERLAIEGHEGMFQETPPQDDHRQTILDPDATHVGIGYASDEGRFQLAEEFLARGLSRLALSRRRAGSGDVLFEGSPADGKSLRFVTIAVEPAPQPLSRETANEHTSYAYPKPGLSYIPEDSPHMHVVGTANEARLKLHSDHSFSFEFLPTRPGLYTLVFYLSARPTSPPRPGASAVLWYE